MRIKILKKMAGLYIHVPFCTKRCIYCDFYSSTNQTLKDAYLAAVIREMELRSQEWRDEIFATIYFGGGTPSQLQQDELQQIINGIYHHFTISDNPEITLEANPDDLSYRYIDALKMLPVNRISIGIQSFDDTDLRLLNRRHTVREAVEAVVRCKEAGFTNISVDLMYGLPGQTQERWGYSVEKAIDLDVTHISAYNLSYEEGTPIYIMWKNNEINPVEDDECERFFRILIEKLTSAGFVHYEISNFAKRSSAYPEGRISLHNSSYWDGTYYLGLGPSAHSYNGNSRSWNISSVTEYLKGEKTPIIEHLSTRERYNDFIITRLRTKWGISIEEMTKKFGIEQKNRFLEQTKPLTLLNKLKNEGGYVKLSSDGLFVSDAVFRELIVL